MTFALACSRARAVFAACAIGAALCATAYGDSSSPRLALMSRSFVTNHYASTWSGSAWSAPAQYNSGPDESIWMASANCNKRNEIAIGTLDYSNDVRVYFDTSAGFSTHTVCTTNTGGYAQRRFDLAYEDTSGDLLVAYWDNAAARIGYRTASSTTLSAQSNYDIGSTSVRFVTLTPQKGTNNIALLTVNSSGSLIAGLWTGASWYGIGAVSSGAVSNLNTECFAVAFEGVTGDALVVYGLSGNSTPKYRTFVAGALSAEQSLPSVSGTPSWIRMISQPGTNTILCAILSSGNQINAYRWNGSSWVANETITSTTGGASDRRFDMVFDPTGSNALMAYSGGNSTIRYKTWSGSSWSGESLGPTFGNTVRIVKLSTGGTGSQILGLVTDDNWQLDAMHWTGSALVSDGVMNNPLGGEADCEAFTIVPPSTGVNKPKIVSWQQVAPQ